MNIELALERIEHERAMNNKLKKRVLELLDKGIKGRYLAQILGVDENVVTRIKGSHKFKLSTIDIYLDKLK